MIIFLRFVTPPWRKYLLHISVTPVLTHSLFYLAVDLGFEHWPQLL
jgi:hypothetical protein